MILALKWLVRLSFRVQVYIITLLKKHRKGALMAYSEQLSSDLLLRFMFSVVKHIGTSSIQMPLLEQTIVSLPVRMNPGRQLSVTMSPMLYSSVSG